MVRANRTAVWTIVAIVLAVTGCCRSGTTHSCDFTPPIEAGRDGGSDGPLMCGTEMCEAGKVCCVTKAPLNATCIEREKVQSLGCEELPLPCLKPNDCPGGLACCLTLNPDGTGTVSCRQNLLCVTGEGTYVACASEADCPLVRPACVSVGATQELDFKVCR